MGQYFPPLSRHLVHQCQFCDFMTALTGISSNADPALLGRKTSLSVVSTVASLARSVFQAAALLAMT